jgi:hypothetical protein
MAGRRPARGYSPLSTGVRLLPFFAMPMVCSEFADACSMERVDDVVWLQWRAALACGHARERSEHLCREFPVEGTEIDIRIDHGNRMVLHKVAVEVLLVPGDQRFDLSRYRGRHMRVVVRVRTVDLGDQSSIVFRWNAGICEEFPDCGGNRGSRGSPG